jgi:NAD(P)H dehydrogenase (quinone)
MLRNGWYLENYNAHLGTAIEHGAIIGSFADADQRVKRGELNDDSGDLRRLIGRPTTPLNVAVAAAV